MSADLHCHTKISDGSTGLDDLILLAKRRRLGTIAVTDHDTLAGVTRAKVLGERHGVKVIPGAEFSCYDYKRKKKVHLLAYLFTYPDRLEGLCKRTGEARKAASLQTLSKVLRYYPITTEMVVRIATGSTNIFKQHIMHTLMNAGYSVTV
ncbi:MAG: PHP domain-containing protein, partial [Ruminococcaceae bacterium]|nr:PHP domain-containing protein [Oscillospiraceae bacterium]